MGLTRLQLREGAPPIRVLNRLNRLKARRICASALLAMTCPLAALAQDAPCTKESAAELARVDARVVLLGELHGTREHAALALRMVCQLVEPGGASSSGWRSRTASNLVSLPILIQRARRLNAKR